jgi:hypothetical protein
MPNCGPRDGLGILGRERQYPITGLSYREAVGQPRELIQDETTVTIRQRPDEGLTETTMVHSMIKTEDYGNWTLLCNSERYAYRRQEDKVSTWITQFFSSYGHDGSVDTHITEPEMRFCSSSVRRGSDGVHRRIQTTIRLSITCSTIRVGIGGTYMQKSCKSTFIVTERYTDRDPSSMALDPPSVSSAGAKVMVFHLIHDVIPNIRRLRGHGLVSQITALAQSQTKNFLTEAAEVEKIRIAAWWNGLSWR